MQKEGWSRAPSYQFLILANIFFGENNPRLRSAGKNGPRIAAERYSGTSLIVEWAKFLDIGAISSRRMRHRHARRWVRGVKKAWGLLPCRRGVHEDSASCLLCWGREFCWCWGRFGVHGDSKCGRCSFNIPSPKNW